MEENNSQDILDNNDATVGEVLENQDEETQKKCMASLSGDTGQLQNLLMHNLVMNQHHKQEIKELTKKNQDLEPELEELDEKSSKKI